MCNTVVVKRLLLSILIWITAFGFVNVNAASASTMLGMSSMALAETPTQSAPDWMTQLEMEILPQIEKVFNPDQQERFQASISEGMSFRKIFTSLMLTPEQKM